MCGQGNQQSAAVHKVERLWPLRSTPTHTFGFIKNYGRKSDLDLHFQRRSWSVSGRFICFTFNWFEIWNLSDVNALQCKVQVFKEGCKKLTKSPICNKINYLNKVKKWEISLIFCVLIRNLNCKEIPCLALVLKFLPMKFKDSPIWLSQVKSS